MTTTAYTESVRTHSAAAMTSAVRVLARGVAEGGAVVKLNFDEEPRAVAWFNTRAKDIFFHLPEYIRLREVAGRPLTEDQFHRVASDLKGYTDNMARRIGEGKGKDPTSAEVAGFLVHEASHAHNSTWGEDIKGIEESVVQTMILFEESRIEKRAVDSAGRGSDLGYGYAHSETKGRYPAFRVKQYLRAVTRLFLETMSEMTHPLQIVHAWALMRGRMISGTMSREEFAPIDNAARTVFGDDLIDELSDIHDEAIGLSIKVNGLDRFIELAREFNEALGIENTVIHTPGCGHGAEPGEGEEDEGEGEGEGAEGEESEGDESGGGSKGEKSESDNGKEGKGEGGNGDSESEGKGEGGTAGEATNSKTQGGIGGGKGDASKDAKPKSGDKEDGEHEHHKPDPSAWDNLDDELPELVGGISPEGNGPNTEFTQAVKQVLDETEWDTTEVDLANPKTESDKVFGKKPDYTKGAWTERPPTPRETTAALKLAQHLESLTIPTIARQKVLTEKPTGRIKSREAVRRSAERAQGRMSTAKPWIDKRMRHGVGAPVIVGIATDTSGSMSWAEKMVASTAYIVGRAGHHINAKTAAVTFGNHVRMVVNPDELPTTVRVHDADGGTEEFDKAMAALDGMLRLTTAPGAKVLVIVSDNELVIPFEGQRRAAWIEKFNKAGVQVIWVDGSDREVPGTTSVSISRSEAHDPMHLVKVISEGIDKSFAKSKGWS